MGKSIRLVGAVALACASIPVLGVSPASAETAAITPSVGAYFASTGIRKPDDFPAPVPVQPNDQGADGVGKGNLAVAARANQVDKVSFLLFDLLAIDSASTVSKAVLSVPTVPNSQSDISVNAAPTRVQACASGDEGFFGEDGAALADAPKIKCDVFTAPAKASADGKAYEFDITGLATTWLGPVNDGVALTVADGQAQQPFQIVFADMSKVTLAVTFTPPVAAPTVPVPPVDTSGGVTGGTGTTPDLGGFGGGVAPAPPVSGGFGSAPAPTVGEVPTPAVGVAPAPAVAAPATTPVAAISPSMRPTGAFWIGGFLLAAALGLLSLIMGDSSVPAAGTGPQSKLARTLSARQRGAALPRLSGRSALA